VPQARGERDVLRQSTVRAARAHRRPPQVRDLPDQRRDRAGQSARRLHVLHRQRHGGDLHGHRQGGVPLGGRRALWRDRPRDASGAKGGQRHRHRDLRAVPSYSRRLCQNDPSVSHALGSSQEDSHRAPREDGDTRHVVNEETLADRFYLRSRTNLRQEPACGKPHGIRKQPLVWRRVGEREVRRDHVYATRARVAALVITVDARVRADAERWRAETIGRREI